MIVTLASAGPERDVAERARRRRGPCTARVLREGREARQHEGRGGRGSEKLKRLAPGDHRDVRSEMEFGPAVDGDAAGERKRRERHAFVRAAAGCRGRSRPAPRRSRAALQAVLGDRARRPRRPAAVRLARRRRLGGRFGSAPPDRPLLEDDPADAAPAVMGVDALEHDRREVLHLEREGALDPHHQGRGFRPRARDRRPRGAALPLDLERAG